MLVPIHSAWHSLCPYPQGIQWMEETLEKLKQNPKQIYLGGFEHDNCVTLGRRLKARNLQLPADLSHWPIFHTERGGEAAIHQPGQLVIYPLASLKFLNLGVKAWSELLLKVSQRVLQSLGKKTELKLNPLAKEVGLYSAQGKLVFLGLSLKAGISTHGIAINVRNDLSLYKNFIACGNGSLAVDQLGDLIPLETLFSLWVQEFTQSIQSLD